jgi:hypothetical protein
MDDHAVLRRVCVEPALYAFAPARTIAATLNEYEAHLGGMPGLGGQHIRETLDALCDLLDPVEAPLVALTAGMARALVASLSQDATRRTSSAPSASQRGIEAAWRFFCWAKDRGYVGNNPFEPLLRGSAADAMASARRERSVAVAARGWVA